MNEPRRAAAGGRAARRIRPATIDLPRDADALAVTIGGKALRLTNLRKPFWPELGITKGDLLRYYAAVSPVLLPHLDDRAMVMKRYPNGAAASSSS